MSKKETTKEIATVKTGFMNLAQFNIADALAEELDGLEGGFERIKIPSAGSTVFELPGEDSDEPETAKEFTAVILYHHPLLAYYKDKYTGGNQPPDCGSIDGFTGIGSPGGNCSTCAYNLFGSGENNSKACKNRRRIYVLREGEIFPLLLSLPTGSLKEFTRYIKRLLSKGRKSNSVVTRFSLKKAVNNGGIAYSQAQFTSERVLSPQELTLIESLTAQVKDYSSNIGFETESTQASEDDFPFVDTATGEVLDKR